MVQNALIILPAWRSVAAIFPVPSCAPAVHWRKEGRSAVHSGTGSAMRWTKNRYGCVKEVAVSGSHPKLVVASTDRAAPAV